MTALKIDIIILSYAKTVQLQQITIEAIESLFLSENPHEIGFEVLVLESNRDLAPYQYANTKTIHPEEAFGFNKYLNIGIAQTSNAYVCLCNNDLIFHEHWAGELIKAMTENPAIQSANPYCPQFGYHERIQNGPDVLLRHQTMHLNGVLTGWCIFVKRSMLETIGLLDEQFGFWYADNDYDFTLRKYKLAHALVKRSKVTHRVSQSHDTLMDKKEEMTTGQKEKFERKWLRKSFLQRLMTWLNDHLIPYKG